jgi:hypothetical protein
MARLNDAIRAVNTKLFWDVSAGDPTSFGGVDCAKSAKQSQIIKEK